MSEFVRRIVKPAGVALASAGIVGLLAVAFSRVLLAVPEAGSTILAFLMAGMILAVIAVIAMTGSTLKGSQKVLLSLAGLGLLGAGAGSTALGVREIHAHLEQTHLAAEGIAFDTDTLELPAETEIALVFTNRDSDRHNVDIFPDDTFAGDALFEGEIFPGVATKTYELPALAEGTYAFRCVVHPTVMIGTVVVSEDGESASGGDTVPVETPDDAPVAGAFEASIGAEDILFDTDALEFPADTPIALTFDNRDPASHNVDIYADDTFTGEPIFSGEVFTGPEVKIYAIDPLAAGTYAFRCLVHPQDMTGTVVVE